MTLVEREVYFVCNSYFVIIDKIDVTKPVTVDRLLHANNPFDVSKSSFRNTGDYAGFYGQVVWSEAGKPEITQTTAFPDVYPEDYDGLPVSTFLTAHYPKATRHRIATLLVPYKLDAPKRILTSSMIKATMPNCILPMQMKTLSGWF